MVVRRLRILQLAIVHKVLEKWKLPLMQSNRISHCSSMVFECKANLDLKHQQSCGINVQHIMEMEGIENTNTSPVTACNTIQHCQNQRNPSL